MVRLDRLTDLEYLKEKIKALIIARRKADDKTQKEINLELEMLYDAKYNLLKKLYN